MPYKVLVSKKRQETKQTGINIFKGGASLSTVRSIESKRRSSEQQNDTFQKRSRAQSQPGESLYSRPESRARVAKEELPEYEVIHGESMLLSKPKYGDHDQIFIARVSPSRKSPNPVGKKNTSLAQSMDISATELSLEFKELQSVKSRFLENSQSIPNCYFNASIHERDELLQPEIMDMPRRKVVALRLDPHLPAKD